MSNISEDDGLTGDAKILSDGHKRYKDCEEQMREVYDACRDDQKFYGGDQWSQEIRKNRADNQRPCLTINRLASPINRVLNEYRTNRPGIKVSGRDSKAKQVTAELIESMIRYICYNSDSEEAFDTASFNQITSGIGYVRVCTDYAGDDSFDQDIRIERLPNIFSVYFPIQFCNESLYEDAPYCFVVTKITKDEFKDKYPKIDMATWPANLMHDSSWVTENEVMLAEYFVKEETQKKLYKLSDGTTTEDKDNLPEGVTVVKERDTQDIKVMRYLLCDGEVLETNEWPSKFLPIVPILGQELWIDGRKRYISLTRFAKDPQRMSNFTWSAMAERASMLPISPWILAEGQIEGHEREWQQANTKHIPYLQYRPLALGDKPVASPTRMPGVSVDEGLMVSLNLANDAIKVTTGVYDAALGAPGPEISGKAILSRSQQSDISNYHFFDNMANSLQHVGRIICDLIPKIYDTPRIIRILGDDGVEDSALVNAQYHQQGEQQIANPNNELYDLTTGKYDVIIEIGPSYNSKKEKSAELLVELVRGNPALAASTSDLLAKLIDAPMEIQDRLRMLLPPQIVTNLKSKDPGKDALIVQLDQLIQNMQQQIAALTAQLKSKMDLENAKTERELIKSQTQIKAALIENEHAVAKEQHRAAHDVAMASHKHNLGMQHPL